MGAEGQGARASAWVGLYWAVRAGLRVAVLVLAGFALAVLLLLAGFGFAVLVAFGVRAQEGAAGQHDHKHAHGHDGELHRRFYADWKRPDFPEQSCCNDEDCYPTRARFVAGHWFAQQRESGQWVRIPPQKIEQVRASPDGRSHVCMRPDGTVFCFVIGGGT